MGDQPSCYFSGNILGELKLTSLSKAFCKNDKTECPIV